MSYPDSPFHTNSIFYVFLEPYLNPYTKQYQKIITFSEIPTGPISEMITTLRPRKLSEFQNPNTYPDCKYVLCRYPPNHNYSKLQHEGFYMGPGDIPALMSYLVTNGYTIMPELTKLVLKTNAIENKQLVLVGKREP